MKKALCLILVLALAVLLYACTNDNLQVDSPSDPTPEVSEATDSETTESTEASTETSVPDESEGTEPEETETTAPLHSQLYLPDCTAEQMLRYFEEVILHIEYSFGDGNPALVQKWLAPISYRIYGAPTEEDLAVLDNLFAELNEIPGFPGIYAAESDSFEQLSLYFLDPNAFRDAFSEVIGGEDAYGATQFWYYTETNEIYNARIGYRTDLDQTVRDSILVEEIVNTLGVSDTILRTDSIVYQYSDDNLEPSDIDWVIIKLLYDPAVQCGMGLEECNAIIESLYY